MKILSLFVLFAALFAHGESSPKLFYVKNDGKVGYINKEGVLIVPLQKFEWAAREYSEGLAAVLNESGWAFLDESGKVKIDLGRRYDLVSDFTDGLALVRKRAPYGFIDKEGREVIKLKYTGTHIMQADGRIAISQGLEGTKKKLVDLEGKVIVPEGVYCWIQPCSGGLTLVATNTPQIKRVLQGFIDRTGAVVVPLEYEMAYLPSEGVLFALKSRVWSAFNTNGVILFRGDFKSCLPFSDGLARIRDRQSDKQGFVDHSGKWAIEPKFEKCASFSEGVAAFAVDGKWGFIDKTGKTVIEPQFSQSEGSDIRWPKCVGGLIQWRDGSKIGYTDKSGKWIWPLSD